MLPYYFYFDWESSINDQKTNQTNQTAANINKKSGDRKNHQGDGNPFISSTHKTNNHAPTVTETNKPIVFANAKR